MLPLPPPPDLSFFFSSFSHDCSQMREAQCPFPLSSPPLCVPFVDTSYPLVGRETAPYSRAVNCSPLCAPHLLMPISGVGAVSECNSPGAQLLLQCLRREYFLRTPFPLFPRFFLDISNSIFRARSTFRSSTSTPSSRLSCLRRCSSFHQRFVSFQSRFYSGLPPLTPLHLSFAYPFIPFYRVRAL